MIEQLKTRFTPKQYLVELLLGLAAVFGLYLIIAWSGYSPIDSTWSVSSYQTDTLNKAGFLGAWLVDLFFSLFGNVGNIIPFVLFIAPIYFLRTKLVDSLTWTRFFLRLAGFVLLLGGLTTLAALLLANPAYYLSGGAVGGMLSSWLLPQLGKFGTILLAFSLSVVGFIFCSGASLLLLVVKFYHWLTIKNEVPTAQPTAEAQENPEMDMARATPQMAEPSNKEADDPSGYSSDFVDVSRFRRPSISGLTTPQTAQTDNVAEQQAAVDTPQGLADVPAPAIRLAPQNDNVPLNAQTAESAYNQFEFTIEPDHLPTVSIRGEEQTLPEMPTVSIQDKSAVGFQEVFAPAAEAAETVRMPTVSLAAEQRAQAVGQAVPQISLPLEDEEMSPTTDNSPAYKPYGESLIHPLLQPMQSNSAKPTTPMPTLDLLDQHSVQANEITESEIVATSQRIMQKLADFGVKATVEDVLVGPVVTRYELALQPGVKAAKVTNIDRDLARALSFRSIRVAEVIPGKPYIGIEVPNERRQTVWLRDVLNSDAFLQNKGKLPMALGKDISGKPIVIDLATTPHLLVAGSTGSGKSVGVNTMILSLLFKVKPDEVKFIMIDPKVVELSIYNDIPHLLTPVVTDMKKAANALRWCVEEMERRYQLLKPLFVRNIEGYNDKIAQAEAMNLPIPNPLWRPGDTMDSLPPPLKKMSYIVLIVDEFADLMMVAGKQIEEHIARLTQKARAVGIHVILATQRPSVDVITGLIKSNIPSRIAFTVVQRNDSRTILDQNGAEALLGRGDMLYLGNGTTDLVRVHGAFMSDEEVKRVADDWRAREKPDYVDAILESVDGEDDDGERESSGGELDSLFDEVTEFVINTGKASTSSVQRRFSIGFNRAARIMDQLEDQGIVSAMQNGKRDVLARSNDY